MTLIERVRTEMRAWRTFFSLSSTGVLVFQEDTAPGLELVWHDRSGARVGTIGTPAEYADLNLSPDGKSALVSIAEPGGTNRDVWIVDVGRGVRTRLPNDAADEIHRSGRPMARG